jgi:hypothetical protein
MVDQKYDMSGISQNWDVSSGLKAHLPRWYGKLLQRD